MKYAVVTFGCRVNQADSLAIEGDLRARGAVPARPDDADLIVVNTCSVTASADQGARQTIRRIARSNPGARVVVTGCYATRRPGELAELPNVARVVRNADKDALVDLIGAGDELSTVERFADGDGPCGSPLGPGLGGRTAFTLRVQTGCDERCSYCIIPSTRGPGRSKPIVQVAADVERAVAAGYKEIVLTGVHLGSYGRDLDEPSSMPALLQMVATSSHDVLFRISSLEPMDCTRDIVGIAAASPRIAPHFHLPLQHGHDEVLRAMRRPYTADFYRRLIDRIHRTMPHASIGSDVIVGFPGETAAQFDDMLRVLEDLPLSHLHVFPYSDRPGTAATGFGDKVEGAVIRARGAAVRAIGERMHRRFREAQKGTTRRALVVDDGMAAVTDNYVKVRLDAPHQRNEWVQVIL